MGWNTKSTLLVVRTQTRLRKQLHQNVFHVIQRSRGIWGNIVFPCKTKAGPKATKVWMVGHRLDRTEYSINSAVLRYTEEMAILMRGITIFVGQCKRAFDNNNREGNGSSRLLANRERERVCVCVCACVCVRVCVCTCACVYVGTRVCALVLEWAFVWYVRESEKEWVRA